MLWPSTKKLGENRSMTTKLQKIGVVGAGTMGGGITMAFANAGYCVRIVDSNPAALERGMQRVRSTYDDAVARSKLEAGAAGARLAGIVAATDLASLADCDIVIEAVFEDLALKSKIAAELGRTCSSRTLIATNTSSLDVDVLAKASGCPERYLGIHFFSPAHIMKLVEVVRGKATAPHAVDDVVALARAIGKVPVVCGVCFGFIGNRMAEPYLREADALLLEGASPAQIDAVAQSPEWLGMAMGPCRMMDLAGLDIGASIVAERAAQTNLLDDASYRCTVRALVDQGHLGQKSGRGIYRYEGRQAVEAPETAALAAELAHRHGVVRRAAISSEEILQRLLYPLINEGFEVLREGITATSADIDTVFTAGYGFPAARGGPMAMAASIGLGNIRRQIESFAVQRGNRHHYWTPSPLLAELSRSEENRS